MPEVTLKKKILHVQILSMLSGVQNSSLYILQNLDLDKYEPWLVCAPNHTGRDTSLISEAEKAGVKVVTLSSLKREVGFHDFTALCEIFKLCRKEKFDIVHTMTSKGGFLGRIAAKLAGCKKVVHTVQGVAFHKYEKPHKRVLYYLMEIIAGLFGDYVVSVNKYYKRSFWFISSKRFKVIYNAFNPENLIKKIPRNDDILKLIFVGRLDIAKSPLDFLAAMLILKQRQLPIEATVIGDGFYYDEMKNYLDNNELNDTVKLLGWQDDVGKQLASHDIFCLTSIFEAFGIVFCEAGYTGLPSVATNVEGIPEVVKDGFTGLLVPPRNPEKFADAVQHLHENRDLLLQFGKNAEQRVNENFTIEIMVNKYQELYEL